MDHFFEEAAEGRIPPQAVPIRRTRRKSRPLPSKYGYEFVEYPQ
jgi:hypothetical protein